MNGWTDLQVDLSELVAAHLVYMNPNFHGHSSNIQCDTSILLKGIENRKSQVVATLDLLTTFIDDGVLVWVNVVGKGARRGNPEVGEELVLGVERDYGEREFLKDRSRRGGRWDNGNRGFDDGRREVLDWDCHRHEMCSNKLTLGGDLCLLSRAHGAAVNLV